MRKPDFVASSCSCEQQRPRPASAYAQSAEPGFHRTQYPASYTHKSLRRTRQFTLPGSAGTQTCLLCLSLKSLIPKLFRSDLGFPIFTGYK